MTSCFYEKTWSSSNEHGIREGKLGIDENDFHGSISEASAEEACNNENVIIELDSNIEDDHYRLHVKCMRP